MFDWCVCWEVQSGSHKYRPLIRCIHLFSRSSDMELTFRICWRWWGRSVWLRQMSRVARRYKSWKVGISWSLHCLKSECLTCKTNWWPTITRGSNSKIGSENSFSQGWATLSWGASACFTNTGRCWEEGKGRLWRGHLTTENNVNDKPQYSHYSQFDKSLWRQKQLWNI